MANKSNERFFESVAKNPFLAYRRMIAKGITNRVPDELHLRMAYRAECGSWPNLESPKGFTEKMQWLKLHDRNPMYTTMVDKFRAKDFIALRAGSEYVVKSLAVWSSADEIDVSELPKKFVIKTNHDCGGVLICTDKESFDLDAAKSFFRDHLKRKYYYAWREWPYKNVKPVVFSEEFLVDEDCNAKEEGSWQGIDEFDFFCFSGEPRLVSYCHGDKNDDGKRFNDFYDMGWSLLPVTMGYASSGEAIPAPKQLGEMIELSRKLSYGVPFLRVDLFICGGAISRRRADLLPLGGSCLSLPPIWKRLWAR